MPRRPRNLLIAESDTVLLSLMAAVFDTAGMHVFKASTIGDAWELICTYKPDAVITSDALKDGSGCELCRWFRQNRYVWPPFIMRGTHEVPVEELEAAGINLFLPEPLDPKVLVDYTKQTIAAYETFRKNPAHPRPPYAQRPLGGMVHSTATRDSFVTWQNMIEDQWSLRLSPGGPPTLKGPILIVDDDSLLAHMLAVIFGQHGYYARIAYSLAHAIKVIDQHTPALVINKDIMPYDDGRELCRYLRGRPQTAAIPIIMVTYHGVEDALNAGADVAVRAPVNPNCLLDIAARLTEQALSGAAGNAGLDIEALHILGAVQSNAVYAKRPR